MAYPASPNPLTANDMNTALLRNPTQQISYNDSEVRYSTGQVSGSVAASNIRGKYTGTIRVTSAYNTGGNAYGWSGVFNGAGGYNPTFVGGTVWECYWSAGINGGTVVISLNSGVAPADTLPALTIKDANFNTIAIIPASSGSKLYYSGDNHWAYFYQTATNWFPTGSVRWVTGSENN